MKSDLRQGQGGFTIIEILIATFVIGVTMVGVFGLFVLSLRLAQEAERRVVAVALANERAEMIRNLPYLDVGTNGGVPSGTIEQSETIVRNDTSYTVSVDIQYVDDPYDGVVGGGGSGGCVEISHRPPGNPSNCNDLCVAAGAVNAHLAHGDSASVYCDGSPIVGDDPLNTDYKQARVEVSWESPNNPKPVLLLMIVSPPGIEGGDSFGTLDFQALNSNGIGVEGATVRLVNDAVDPVIDLTTSTNAEGRLVLPGLHESAGTYELEVSKTGYTTERTYDASASFFPDPNYSHLSMIIGELTSKTFFIDLVSRLDVLTAEPVNSASLEFTPTGGDDYVEVGDDSAYGVSDGTAALWIKPRSLPGSQGVISKDQTGLNDGDWSLSTQNGDLFFDLEGLGNKYTAFASGAIEVNNWYHVAATWGASGMKLYVDGSEVGSDGFTGGTSDNSEPIAIGAMTNTSGAGSISPVTAPFDGLIDDVRLYSSALGQSDIQLLADGNDFTLDLESHWKFNDSAGPAATDSGVVANDGIWQNSVSRSWDTPFTGGAGDAVPDIGYQMTGTKNIGTDASAAPVYVIDVENTTDSNGQAAQEDLVWDQYSVEIDGSLSGYDIRESSLLLPLTLDPGDDLDLDILLVDHTPISLHVTVVDVNGSPIPDATVALTEFGHDETLTTGSLGQSLFADLPSNGDYTIDVSATGFTAVNTSVTVSDTSFVLISLNPS